MAFTTCAKCGHRSFELKMIEPRGGTYKQCVVQCASCGGAIGVTSYRNAAIVVDDLEKKMKRGFSVLEDRIQHLERLLRSR